MLSLESNFLVFTFNGAEKKLRFPTVGEWGEYQNKIDGVKDGGSVVAVALNFLVDLGLDKPTADRLENSHLETILGELSAAKKK